MSLGFERDQNVVNLSDTAPLRAFLYDEDDKPLTNEDVVAVSFVVQKPDKTKTTVAGIIEDDGSGTAAFNGTDQVGQYIVVASFTTVEDGTQSTRADFEVVDPFLDSTPSPSWVVADAAWSKLEDCFDGEDEGPWLRDMTLNTFNKTKMEKFIEEALFDINQQNPPTDLRLSSFAYQDGAGNTFATADLPLITSGVLVAVIRHLMRSYVEQPNPVGAQIAWHDRRDYQQRWQQIYQIELEQYRRILALFKRRYLGLGDSKLLLSSKAGRLIPAPMRTRNVGRGYW